MNNAGEIDTYIGVTTEISGDLVLAGTLRVDGRVKGNITGRDNVVIIGKSGVVDGNIAARYVFVGGRIRGDIVATHGIEVLSSAVIEGNLHYFRITVEEGASVQGNFRRLEEPGGEAGEAPGPGVTVTGVVPEPRQG